MYDPCILAFEIKSPFKDKSGYRNRLISIWHKDPEKDGTDDSCGWFIRLRHADNDVYEKIVKEFESEWDNTYKSEHSDYVYNQGWFTPEGKNVLSVQGIVFNMYLYAAKIVFNPKDKISPKKAWEKAFNFMYKNHAQIFYFAENNRDSMSDTITRKFEIGCNEEYTAEKRNYMIRHCASVIYTDILRKERKWWQHPKWHIHHWSVQFNFLQSFKRRYWDKCSKCGKRGFKGAVMSDWGGKNIWHEECDDSCKKPIPVFKNDWHELVDRASCWLVSLSEEELADVKFEKLNHFNSRNEYERIMVDLYLKYARNNKDNDNDSNR